MGFGDDWHRPHLWGVMVAFLPDTTAFGSGICRTNHSCASEKGPSANAEVTLEGNRAASRTRLSHTSSDAPYADSAPGRIDRIALHIDGTVRTRSACAALDAARLRRESKDILGFPARHGCCSGYEGNCPTEPAGTGSARALSWLVISRFMTAPRGESHG